ncbi:MAG: methyltransferase domain-containing protein [Gemmatimonadetes bacterium]|nr:methyltransferase domain-containing protein [Gemmatimonadota bacterium]
MTEDVQTLRPKRVSNRVYHLVGLVLMALNVVRHRIRGYRQPRPFTASGAREAMTYDNAVVENWLRHLEHYLDEEVDLAGKRVLEIGPGPDLGTGLNLLARGAAAYVAVDKHPLLGKHATSVHRALLGVIAEDLELDQERVTELRKIVDERTGDPDGPLAYHHLPEFDLSVLPEQSADLVLSHSAFEHLDDVETTFRQLAPVAAPGCVLVTEIDLQTHTRWIRDADPLNIYRYRNRTYQALGFSGSPNRVRPDEYLSGLEAAGWTNPRFYPRRVLDRDYVHEVEPSLARRFQGDPEQLAWLSIVLCATRKRGRRWKANP